MKSCPKIHILLLLLIGFPFFLHGTLHAQSQRNMSVQVIIPPNIGDFNFRFASQNDHIVRQDETLKYEITYGASASAGQPTATTIVVHYSSDKSPDNAYIVDYVIGSATNAYNGTHPIIDRENRTITWNIASLPEGTLDQKISFELRTNSNYTEKKKITFISRASFNNEFITLPDQYVDDEYLYETPKPGPNPTTTASPNITPTPTSTISTAQFNIVAVTIDALSPTAAKVSMTTNQPSRIKINYGISPAALSSEAENTNFSLGHSVDLTKLRPNTPYYFQIVATNTSGRTISSDIFTFTTPNSFSGNELINGENAVSITSGGTLLLSRVLHPNTSPSTIVIPSNTSYKLTYTYGVDPDVSYVDVIIKSENGIANHTRMSALDAYTYFAQLSSGAVGRYEIIIVQKDEKDNIMSRNVSILRVVNPLTVLEDKTGIPIGDARVYLSYYDIDKKAFVPLIVGQNGIINNPVYTYKNGQYSLSLPNGTYMAEVSALFHKNKSVTFKIGPENGMDYPSIMLEKELLNISFIFNYSKDAFIYYLDALRDLLHTLSDSLRAYYFAAFTSLSSFVLLSVYLFKLRTSINWKHLFPFVVFHLAITGSRHRDIYIKGIVLDGENKPLRDARIEVVPFKEDIVLTHTATDREGRFQIKNMFKQEYVKLLISKEGYPIAEMIVKTDDHAVLRISLTNNSLPYIKKNYFVHDIAGSFFEVFLIMSMLVELVFIESFGVLRSLPFVFVSLATLLLWLFYQRETHTK